MVTTICTIGAILLAFSIYVLLRKLFGKDSVHDDHDLPMALIARLGTLHALILALIFAAEM